MELEELDDSWIKEINEDEKIYNKFYTSSPNYVNLYITYLNNDNSIIHIKTTTASLSNNVFSKNTFKSFVYVLNCFVFSFCCKIFGFPFFFKQ